MLYYCTLMEKKNEKKKKTGKFADFEQFKNDSHFANFGKVQSGPNCSFLLTLGRSQLFY